MNDSVILFTRFGLGEGPENLQSILCVKFLTLILESGSLPSKILFYTNGVRLCCSDSPVIEQLRFLEKSGVELILCKTCLDAFELTKKVEVGIPGGMGDILEAIQKAPKIISV